MKFSCVILAAGNGTRFGGRKQFAMWQGKPLWKHVYDTASMVSDDVIVVGVHIDGGKKRCDSVYNGLKCVKHNRVVILEAARPRVTAEQIFDIANCDAVSVSYAIPSDSTIFYKDEVLNRDETYILQVPQAFDTFELTVAHERTKNILPTDDTMLIAEVYGIKPALMIGDKNLKKITYKEDLEMIE